MAQNRRQPVETARVRFRARTEGPDLLGQWRIPANTPNKMMPLPGHQVQRLDSPIQQERFYHFHHGFLQIETAPRVQQCFRRRVKINILGQLGRAGFKSYPVQWMSGRISARVVSPLAAFSSPSLSNECIP